LILRHLLSERTGLARQHTAQRQHPHPCSAHTLPMHATPPPPPSHTPFHSSHHTGLTPPITQASLLPSHRPHSSHHTGLTPPITQASLLKNPTMLSLGRERSSWTYPSSLWNEGAHATRQYTAQSPHLSSAESTLYRCINSHAPSPCCLGCDRPAGPAPSSSSTRASTQPGSTQSRDHTHTTAQHTVPMHAMSHQCLFTPSVTQGLHPKGIPPCCLGP
jgi:hypothetical protein